jgi:type I restriction enzyme, S subunit
MQKEKTEKIREGYKKTEVGIIPEDWELKNLGKSASLKARIGWQGLTTSEYRNTGDYYLITGTEFRNGSIDWESCYFVNKDRYKQDKNIQINRNDVLVTKDGTIGKVAFVKKLSKPATLNSGVFVIRPLNQEFAPEYLYYILLSKTFSEFLFKLTAGSTITHLYQKDFIHFSFQVPSILSEQYVIANILSDTDKLIENLEKLIDKKKKIKKGAMQELLTGKRRLPGFSGDWEILSLEELEKNNWVKLSRGKVISNNDIEKRPGQYPVYSSSVHNNGLFGKYGDYMFNEELITWSVDGGGNFFYRPKHKFSVTNVCGFIKVSKNKLNCFFLSNQLQLLHSKMFFDYTMKAHPSIIRKKYIVNIPDIKEQTAIANILSAMDKEIESLEKKIDKYKKIKVGMMQQLLTGKIRVYEPAK